MAAVALVGLQGALLAVVGLAFIVAGIFGSPADVLDAVLVGSISLLGGVGLLLVARGLAGCRAWARSPALVWDMIMIGVGATQYTENPVLAVPMFVVGLLTVLALFHSDTSAVLED